MDEIVLDAQQRMEKSIESLRMSLVTLRTGRANPAILSTLMIDYYGSPTPVNQISSIMVPEPRQLLIK
ncbi:MAG: ribosome recycling factor, partial [Bacilli bacterium]